MTIPTLPCVTTWNGRGGCRVHSEHLSSCRGIRLDGDRATACDGCLPQPATHGVLCESCWERFTSALDVACDLITHMRSVERNPVPDGPKVATSKPGSRVIVPMSWLTADDTWAILHELAFRIDPTAELLAGGTTAYGFGSRDSIEHVRERVAIAVEVARRGDVTLVEVAINAVAFYQAVQVALHRYPLEEQTRLLPYARCNPDRGGCGHMTLERRPPLQYLDPLVYRCVNPACGAEFDPFVVEVDLAEYRRSLEAAA